MKNIAAAALLVSIGAGSAAQLKGTESITMPIFGDSQSINNIWRARDGNLVFEFFYRKNGHSFADFFDTHTGKRLFPARAEEMAHSPGGVLQDELRPKGLSKVKTSLFSMAGPNDSSVAPGGYEGGSLCGVQYSSPIVVQTKNAEYRLGIYSRSTSLREFDSPCGGGKVHLRYKEVSVEFIAADQSGFWVLLPYSSAVVRFDWNGRSSYFNGRADPVLVPYEKINSARKHVEDRVPTQTEYQAAEGIFQQYSRQQVQTPAK